MLLLELAFAAAIGVLVGVSGGRCAGAKWLSTTTASVLGAIVALLAGHLPTPHALPWMHFLVVMPMGVLVGLGMLGAGIVMRAKSLSRGLTEAATLLVCGVIGISIGGGQAILGFITAVLVVISLQGGGWLEQRVSKGSLDD